MQQAAWRTAVFRVGMEYRFVPPMRHFIDGARAGRLGRLPRIALHEHRHSFLPKADDWNRFAASAGGTTIEKRCHFLNLMRCMVVAEPVRTHCPGAMNGDHRDDRVPDIIDNSLTTVHVENGLRAMPDLCTSADGPEEQEQLVAIGGAARLEAGIPSRALCVSPRVPPGAPRRVGR